MGTPQSHDQEHCGCASCFSSWKITKKLAGRIPNGPRISWAGTPQVLCPFAFSVFSVFPPGALAFIPSVTSTTTRPVVGAESLLVGLLRDLEAGVPIVEQWNDEWLDRHDNGLVDYQNDE